MNGYKLVGNRPVAKFRYRGHHSHPVRVTMLVIEDKPNLLVGYVLRSGNTTYEIGKLPIKSYRKDKIAKYGDYCRLKAAKENKKRKDNETTLQRMGLSQLLAEGV